MSRPIARRGTFLLASTAALIVAAFAAVPAAQASTLYACVAKNGSAHLYAKKPKKGEKLLSWNSAGINGASGVNGAPGAPGAAGAKGANGANGAVAGYVVKQVGSVNITEEEHPIVSKSLPAGSYIVSAKVETSAAGKSAGMMESRCELFDGTTLDESQWISGLAEFGIGGIFLASTTLPLETAVTLTKTTPMEVWCETQLNKATSGEMSAADAVLVAVQTSSNS